MTVALVKRCAEDHPVGAMLEWDNEPGVRVIGGRTRAPSRFGTVAGHSTDLSDGYITGHALVRFLLQDGSWSKPLELTAGIECKVWVSP